MIPMFSAKIRRQQIARLRFGAEWRWRCCRINRAWPRGFARQSPVVNGPQAGRSRWEACLPKTVQAWKVAPSPP